MLTIIINILLFLVLIFTFIYLPGFLLISKVKDDLDKEEVISLSLCLGAIFLVSIAVIFGILHLRLLVLPTLIGASLISLVKLRKYIFIYWISILRNRLLLSVILLGILMQGFINFPSGFQYKEGLLFWSSQGFDGFWQISVIEEIKKEFPPKMPIFSGENLFNYHYLVDVLMGEFSRIFPFFSSLDLHFRLFPIFFSFLMGVSIYSFVQRWQGKKTALWALFFTYFTGSFGYIFTFIKEGKIFGGETTFWAAQLNTVIANPPHAIAISLLSAFLLSFLIFLKDRRKAWFAISFLCVFMIAGFKVSAGVVVLSGLVAGAVINIIVNRNLTVLYLLILIGISNYTVVKLMTRGAENILIFEPWWFIRTMIVVKLDWVDLELRRQHYISKGTWHASLRVIQLELLAFSIFLIGNLGTRFIGFIDLFKKIFVKKQSILTNLFEISLFVMMLTSFIVPMLFLQKGMTYNSIQFMQYFLLFFGFYAAITTTKLVDLIKNKLLKFLFITLLIIFSVPTVIGNLVELYGPNASPLAMISKGEQEGLKYLKDHTEKMDIVLTKNFDKYARDRYPVAPLPMWAWSSTAYVSGMTGRTTYVSSEDIVDMTGYDYKERMKMTNNFFEQKDAEKDKEFLKSAKIRYIYIPKEQLGVQLDLEKNNLEVGFENSQVLIYKVIN